MAEVAASTTGRTKPFRVAEVATMLDVHPATIYRHIEAGRLRALRVGAGNGTIRILPNALADFLTLLQERTGASVAEVA
jgi:excisionase family DNA binding protein